MIVGFFALKSIIVQLDSIYVFYHQIMLRHSHGNRKKAQGALFRASLSYNNTHR
jgi:hypothetical protein